MSLFLSAKPFIKWAGGKTQLIRDIQKSLPKNLNKKFTYIEPFVGSGAILFWMLNNFENIDKAVINDINKDFDANEFEKSINFVNFRQNLGLDLNTEDNLNLQQNFS